MSPSRSWLLFLLVLACAAAFVHFSSASLPERVGSHFAASGTADGFAPREGYRAFMLAFAAGFPLLVVALMTVAFTRSGAALNLPNRDFWLAPERRRTTVNYLVRRATGFGMMMSVFLCYVHWLVVGANRVQPPHLSSGRMIGGLVVFVLLTFLWLNRLWLYFRRAHRSAATDSPAAAKEGHGS